MGANVAMFHLLHISFRSARVESLLACVEKRNRFPSKMEPSAFKRKPRTRSKLVPRFIYEFNRGTYLFLKDFIL